ncbi:Crp/Fnr family transcriptional regulator [Chitinophaga sp. RAB17]|uniref:Crp/Fnr family transcriptional regulator n=1 Tax=Chitinophaga sp. RAB17 TaxID=3233049 RepID=UPI003F926DB2
MPEITTQNIKDIFDQFYKADAKTWEGFTSKLQERRFRKNEVIKDYGTTEKYLNILISGTAALFIWNGKHDICINLFYENDFFGDYLSFLKQEQKPLKTVALEDIVIWSISHTDLKALYDSTMLGSTMARIMAETLYAKKQEEQINLLTLTAEERYIKLIKVRPQIVQRTSLKFIASYLGVTSESLSRIRKRVTLKQIT